VNAIFEYQHVVGGMFLASQIESNNQQKLLIVYGAFLSLVLMKSFFLMMLSPVWHGELLPMLDQDFELTYELLNSE